MNHALSLNPTRLSGFKAHWGCFALILCLGLMQTQLSHAQAAPGMAGPGEPGMGMHGMQGMHHGPMDPARMEKMWQRRMEHFDAHMAQMKKRLDITPAQEGAWGQFVLAIRPADHPEQRPMGPEQWKETMQLKAPERMEKMLAQIEAHHAQRLALMHQHLDALKAFYPQLSEQQQKVFDSISRHPMGKRPGWRHP